MVSNYINTQEDTLQLQKTVLVEADIMFINGMALLVSIYKHVKFTTVKYLGKIMMGNISTF